VRSGLIIPDDIREAILNHASNCQPEECCGLIALDDEGRVRFAYPLTNVDKSEDSFTIDPTESYHAFLHAEGMDWEIAGVFHSHPDGPDVLSDRDIAEAPDGWIHFLMCADRLKAFRVSDGIAKELDN
jgi:proteasome lid subunit RPN8/RPN11